MTDIIRELEKFIYEYSETRRKLGSARTHILSNLKAFSIKELECMATDGIIKHSDIPNELRTNHSKFMAEREHEAEKKD